MLLWKNEWDWLVKRFSFWFLVVVLGLLCAGRERAKCQARWPLWRHRTTSYGNVFQSLPVKVWFPCSFCQPAQFDVVNRQSSWPDVELAGLSGLTSVDFPLQDVSRPSFLQTIYYKHAQINHHVCSASVHLCFDAIKESYLTHLSSYTHICALAKFLTTKFLRLQEVSRRSPLRQWGNQELVTAECFTGLSFSLRKASSDKFQGTCACTYVFSLCEYNPGADTSATLAPALQITR